MQKKATTPERYQTSLPFYDVDFIPVGARCQRFSHQNHKIVKSTYNVPDSAQTLCAFNTMLFEQRKSDDADDDGQQRARGSGKSHGEERVGEELRGQVHARYAHERDCGDVVDKRYLGAAAGAEIPAEAEVYSGEERVPDVAAQVLPAEHDDYRVRREQADRLLGDELRQQRDDDAETHRDDHRVAQRLLGARLLPRADVLRAERRHR